MRQVTFNRSKHLLALLSVVFITTVSNAQPGKKIDWKNDTLSKSEALSSRSNYLDAVRRSGQKATERIMIPVEKLKDVMDACAAKNITEVAVYIITLRDSDVERYKRNNPSFTGPNNQLTGSQMLVFKIPRRAFADALGAKTEIPNNNPIMLSLLGAGLVMMNAPYAELPAGGDDIFLTFGNICPPPASCGD